MKMIAETMTKDYGKYRRLVEEKCIRKDDEHIYSKKRITNKTSVIMCQNMYGLGAGKSKCKKNGPP